jgi:hypothetical protein
MCTDLETVSFEADSQPGWFIRHSSFLGVLSRFREQARRVVDRSPLEKWDATFVIHRPGLIGTPDSVSFESANYPGQFLRHQNYRVKLQADDGFGLFPGDASFFWGKISPWQDLKQKMILESVNFRGHYIAHRNFELWLTAPRVDPFRRGYC